MAKDKNEAANQSPAKKSVNKTQAHLTELANNGDETARKLADLYNTAMSLKPRSDSSISTLRKAAAMLPPGPGRDALEAEIASKANDSNDDNEPQLLAVAREVSNLTTKSFSHFLVKAIGKAIGDWRYGQKDDDESASE